MTKTKTKYNYNYIPLKVKDGLYMADQFTARVPSPQQDLDFILLNQVTHIINSSYNSHHNSFRKSGISYLNFSWSQHQTNVTRNDQIFAQDKIVNNIIFFIDQAQEQGTTCLIHSASGKSRAISICCAYLMKKFEWTLLKSLDFINSKHNELQIRQNFYKELQRLQKKIKKTHILSDNWDSGKNQDDILLKNTLINQKIPIQNIPSNNKQLPSFKVTWKDHTKKQKLTKIIPLSKNGEVFRQQKKTCLSNITSIMKGSAKVFDKYSGSQILKPILNMQEEKKEIVNNFSGNIIHLTVNNFVGLENVQKKTLKQKKKQIRGFSSDSKMRLNEQDQQIREKVKKKGKNEGNVQKKAHPFKSKNTEQNSRFQSRSNPRSFVGDRFSINTKSSKHVKKRGEGMQKKQYSSVHKKQNKRK